MTFAAIHPGIQNEYVFYGATADEAEAKLREHLEKVHGGLAGGMLASSRIEEVKAPDTEDLGRCWNNTPMELNQCGVEWAWASDATPEQWANNEGYYSDEGGSASILVLSWGEEDEE